MPPASEVPLENLFDAISDFFAQMRESVKSTGPLRFENAPKVLSQTLNVPATRVLTALRELKKTGAIGLMGSSSSATVIEVLDFDKSQLAAATRPAAKPQPEAAPQQPTTSLATPESDELKQLRQQNAALRAQVIELQNQLSNANNARKAAEESERDRAADLRKIQTKHAKLIGDVGKLTNNVATLTTAANEASALRRTIAGLQAQLFASVEELTQAAELGISFGES